MGVFQNINAIWSKVGLVQKALLSAIVIACILTGILLTQWATRPDMRLLFGNLSIEESAKITEKISEQNVFYEVRGNGSSIYVPADQIYTLRASLARDGLMPRSGEPGYEIFDNEKLGVSPMVQKMNYNRAIQGELARTIQVFEGVEFARVHIVRPEQTMFVSDGDPASASVMLRLKPGFRISNSTIAAISNLVAGAIEGLSPEKVMVTDSNGRMLTSQNTGEAAITGANSYKDYKASVEQEMTQRLMQSLEMVLGPGRATVIAQASVDMTKETVVRKIYEKGIPAEEVIQESKTVQDAATDDQGNATKPGSQETSGTTTSTYKIPETTTTTSTVPGKVTAWSVSVMVDLTKDVIPAENVEGESEEETTTAAATDNELIMTVDDVKEIVRTAIGPTLIKDEDLTVKHIAFNRPQAAIMSEETSTYDKLVPVIEIVRQSSIGILAVCALLILKIFTSSNKKAAAETTASTENQQSLPMMPHAMLPAGQGNEAITAIRQQIGHRLRENPEQVRQLFSSWLSEEK